MSTPSTLTISLPPRFNNSYWTSPEYRIGVEELYSKLQQGIDENASIIALVQHRAEAEYRHAEHLATPAPAADFEAPIFRGAVSADHKDARSLYGIKSTASFAFRSLEQETARVHANAHGKIARALERSILMPFSTWSREHRDRIRQSWEDVDAALSHHERMRADVMRLRNQYEAKCQNADEAEDDARFIGQQQDQHSDSSPAQSSADFTEATDHSDTSATSSTPSAVPAAKAPVKPTKPEKLDPDRLKRRETLRAQFGFRRSDVHEQAPPVPQNSSQRSASAELPPAEVLRDVPFAEPESEGLRRSSTISHAFTNALTRASGAPAFQNLRAAVGTLNGPRHIRLRKEAETAEQMYKDLVRQLDRARCNLEDLLAEHFTLAERWETNRLGAVRRVLSSFNNAFSPLAPVMATSLDRSASLEPALDVDASLAQTIVRSRLGQYSPHAEVFQPYYHDDASAITGAGLAGFGMDLVAYVRAETLLSENTDIVADGIRAGSGISKNGMPPLPLVLAALLGSLERRYADDSAWVPQGEQGAGEKSVSLLANEEKRRAWIYEVPLPNIHLCREAIISHLLGNSVPGANVGAGLEDKLKRFDAPTLASTVKLWALELADSLLPMRLWDQVVSTYQAAADQERDANKTSRAAANDVVDAEKPQDLTEGTSIETTPSKGKTRAEGLDPVLADTIRKEVMSDLSVILSRLPKIHLVCLDALTGHLSRLIKSTPTEESDILFVNKVALSLSRALIRPSRETSATLRSLSPVLLAFDLITYYDDLLPKTMAATSKEGEKLSEFQRKTPIRKRTKPVDQRISRSSLTRSAGKAAAPTLTEEPEEANTQATTASTIPRINTSNLASASTPRKVSETEEQSVTPIATRILPTRNDDKTPRKGDPAVDTQTLKTTNAQHSPELERALSPSTHSADSAYGTPDEDEERPTASKMKAIDSNQSQQSLTSASSKAAAASASSAKPKAGSSQKAATDKPTSPAAEEYDEDKPLTNVARLSRQFGKMGSSDSTSTTGATATVNNVSRGSRVRGPRPAN